MKKCTKCGDVKGLECYGKNIYHKNGKQNQCNECKKKYLEEKKQNIKDRKKYNYFIPGKIPDYIKLGISRIEKDWEISNILNIKVGDCPQDLIKLKREQLQIKRLTKQLTEEIKNVHE